MIVAIDYETSDSRGASFEYFRKDFKIFSLSCAWRDESGSIVHWFSSNSNKIRLKLADLARSQDQLVVHNLAYEGGVTASLYPGIKLNWYADTMRMAQIDDGGGDEFNPPELTLEQSISYELGEITEKEANKIRYGAIGLSLEACAARVLTDTSLHNHKKVAHQWLEDNHGIKKNFGGNLHLLPYKHLEQYNNADTTVTLLLYEYYLKQFKANSIEWVRDHDLYKMRCNLIPGAYQRGIIIDQERLYNYIVKLEEQITDIEVLFLQEFASSLDAVAHKRFNKISAKWADDPKLKTDKARFNRWIKLITGHKDEEWREFNVNSSAQLTVLFTEVLNIKPEFLTPKGSPSFKTTHLVQWGKGGEILSKRKKLNLVLSQCVNTYLASLYDGRVHCSIKVSGTRTNRVAGGTI